MTSFSHHAILLLALFAVQTTSRTAPTDAGLNDQKNFFNYGGVGDISGENGFPFGGLGSGLGGLGGGIGGLDGGGIGGLGGGGIGGGIGGGVIGGIGGGAGFVKFP